MHTLCFSQSIDYLLDNLKTSLHGKPTFLATQTVIVGSAEMKERVLFALCEDLSVGCTVGIQVIVKDQLTSFLEGFFSGKAPTSRLEVSLKIEEFLRECIEKNREDPLIFLIKEDPEKRLPLFSEKLSEIFMKYSLFSPDFFGKDSAFISEIFSKIWEDASFKTLDSETLLIDKISSKRTVHLFCCRYFPPFYTKIFEKFAKICSIRSYILSPSEHFWEDFLSDYEEKRFLKKLGANQPALKELLADKHPLLANFGVMKREYLKSLNQDFANVEEDYSDMKPVTLLEHLRADLLDLNKEKKILEEDDSLQVFKTKSKLEEVLLIKQIMESHSKEISYRKMAVYVPDIDAYAPFIEMVFGLDAKIYGKSLKTVSHKLQGILDLFSMLENGVDITNFHSLLFNPSFQEKRQFSKEEVQRITRWFSSVNLHRDLDIEKFDKLIFGLVYSVDKEEFASSYPMFGIEMNDADLLERLVIVVTKLREDVSFFQKKRTLSDYLLRLKDLEDFYFFDSEKPFLSSVLESFHPDFLINREIPFVSLLYRVRSLIEKKKLTSTSNKIDLPTFSCLKNNICSSFSIIFLMGMSESSFSYRKDPLDPMKYSCYTPSQKDQDHGFLLEALLLAKSKLVCTYSEKNEGENLALMIHELFSYLDTYYLIQNKKPSEVLLINKYGAGFHKKEIIENKKVLQEELEEEPLREKKLRAQDLLFFAKYPLKFYFQKCLQVDLERSFIGKIRENFDFAIENRDKGLFKHLLLKQGFVKTEDEFRKQDFIPLSYIYKGILPEFKYEEKEIEDLLQKFSLKRENFSSMNLQENPITIPFMDSSIEISGVFDLQDAGFILPEDQIERVSRIWPAILLHAYIHKTSEIPLYFIKEKSKKILLIENPERDLVLYLDYYFSAKMTPSPLISFFAKSLLLKDLQAFLQKTEQVENLQYEDPYLELFLLNYSMEDVYVKWQEKLRSTFLTLIKSYEKADATV